MCILYITKQERFFSKLCKSFFMEFMHYRFYRINEFAALKYKSSLVAQNLSL